MNLCAHASHFYDPLIPDNNLYWQSFPIFHVGMAPGDFGGTLFFVLGQGLGDHVNGLRILHELQLRFPRATCIVYGDRRWEEILRRMEDVRIRWYPKALDPRTGKGTNDPYALTHAVIRKEIGRLEGGAFLALDHFPMPDRHARGETTLEAISRSIGMPLGTEARPYFPFHSEDKRWAEGFLKDHSLEAGGFVVLAPFSWPNKMWPKDRFVALADWLYQERNLRSVIVSYPEIGGFDSPGGVLATDLSLGQIGGLLSMAGAFVGLDSGPSHLAAAFDLPMAVIFVERGTIPFEVRALSPWALHVVEGFVSPERDPSLNTVCRTIAFLLDHRPRIPEMRPVCPACLRPAHFVTGVTSAGPVFMCVCGMRILSEKEEGDFFLSSSLKKGADGQEASRRGDSRLEVDISSDLGTLSSTKHMDTVLEAGIYETVTCRLSRVPPDSRSSRDGDRASRQSLIWSQDGLVFWMRRNGYGLGAVRREGEGSYLVYQFFKEKIGTGGCPKGGAIRIPWSEGTLRLAHRSDYLAWFSFERWGRFEDLVGIVKSLNALGYHRDAVRVAWVAVRARLSLRSIRWLLKALYYRVIRGDKSF